MVLNNSCLVKIKYGSIFICVIHYKFVCGLYLM
jgi:hypothetical protein